MAVERECKIPVPRLAPLTERLQALGAMPLAASRREHNEVFDTPDNRLFREGKVLRLRTHSGTPGGLATVKTVVLEGAFKAREEIETAVDDPSAVRRQWRELGFTRIRVYEKDRAEWLWRGARIALDRCPEIGDFIEVEGGEDLICDVLADLGVDPSGHVADNYLELWRKHLARLGDAGWRDMVFPPTAPGRD